MHNLAIVAVLILIFVYRDNIRTQYNYYCVRANIEKMRLEIDILNRQLKDREAAIDAECKRDPAACATAAMVAQLNVTAVGMGAIVANLDQIKADLTATAKQYVTSDGSESALADTNAQLAILNKRIASAREDVKSATS